MPNTLYIRIKDLDERGGGFIREKKIGATLSGEIYSGTVFYNNGKNARVIALIYPHGNGRILGQAGNSEETGEAFRDFMGYLNSLEEEKEFKFILKIRMILGIITKSALFLSAAGVALSLTDINPFASIWNAAYLTMEVIGTVLIAKIGSFVKEL